MDALEDTYEKVESASSTPEIAPQVQTLIKDLFAFSSKDNPECAALEGAVALAKFGQIERAINELSLLLDKETVRIAAAKNIIRCYRLLSKFEQAVVIYHQWASKAVFPEAELKEIRLFFEKLLNKDGIDTTCLNPRADDGEEFIHLPVIMDKAKEIDIGSVIITLDSGPLQGKPVELDVKLQAGNIVSLIIESKDKALLDNLHVGFRLKNIQFNSTVAIFRGEGLVSAKAMIDSGPKQGDYHLDIKITDA